jgi:anti-anti-sigma factor
LGAPDESPAASLDAQRPARDSQTLVVTVSGSIGREDAARFGEKITRELGATRTTLVVCDVSRLARPDAAAVDLLCRIRLAARRRGGRLLLRGASTDLLNLIELVGLCDILPEEARSGVQVKR